MTKQLEDVLRRLQRSLVEAGEVAAARGIFEHVTAAAVASELQAAMERGDAEAVEFHTQFLERQLSVMSPLRFDAGS